MSMKEICIDCLCLQLQLINDNSENPAKVRELVEELLSEYDDLRPTPLAPDACPVCHLWGAPKGVEGCGNSSCPSRAGKA